MYGPRYMMFENPEEVRGGGLCFGVLCLFESIGKVCPSGETPANNIILLYWLSSRNARCLHEGEMQIALPLTVLSAESRLSSLCNGKLSWRLV